MKNLRKMRKEKGYTCESLGKLVGVQKSAMSKYERGDIQPSHEVLVKLAEILNCSTDYLLGKATAASTPGSLDPMLLPQGYIDATDLSEESRQDLLKHMELLKMRDQVQPFVPHVVTAARGGVNDDSTDQEQVKRNLAVVRDETAHSEIP